MPRFIYNLVLLLIFPLVLVRLLYRSLRQPAYRQRLRERMGWFEPCPAERVIWLHAVSVGEVVAATPLINKMLEDYPHHQLVVTTTTPTGSAQLVRQFGDKVFHVYAPYDLAGAVKRFLDQAHPELVVVMETEIWPNLFYECSRRQIPIILANARLSEKSARGYRRVLSLTRSTLRCISIIATQHQQDANRFAALGALPDQLTVMGSIKFDMALPPSLREQAEAFRQQLGAGRSIWIAASTHEGEEELVLDAYEQLRAALPDVLLVLVPRHPDRFDRVATLCEKRGYQMVRRSLGQACQQGTQVYLGDTMGELLLLYAAADVGFVGGSLVPVGGHNPLEPAALGVPVIVGPHTFNFNEIVSRLQERQGLLQVEDQNQLASNTELLLRDLNMRHRMGEQAIAFVDANRGALSRLQQLISETMPDQYTKDVQLS